MSDSKLVEGMAESLDKSFDDAELQDIMNEIESLEKEFVEDSTHESDASLALTQASDNNLQGAIDAELQSVTIDPPGEESAIVEVAEVAEVAAAPVSAQAIEAAPVAEVINQGPVLVPDCEPSQVSSSGGGTMDFTASGNINLSLNFQVGEKQATLVIDKETGLKIEMNGVKLQINEKNGCSMTMPSGVSFNIPLTEEVASTTKKAA